MILTWLTVPPEFLNTKHSEYPAPANRISAYSILLIESTDGFSKVIPFQLVVGAVAFPLLLVSPPAESSAISVNITLLPAVPATLRAPFT